MKSDQVLTWGISATVESTYEKGCIMFATSRKRGILLLWGLPLFFVFAVVSHSEAAANKRKPAKARRAATAKPAPGEKVCPPGFVYIPPGSFTMGSPPREKGREKDETRHRVTISRGFCMGKYEVTQGEWEAAMGDNPSNLKECGKDCPVESVDWKYGQEFITKYNELHGGGYRLPTEAEWEYAARAGTKTAFYTGAITNVDYPCGHNPALDPAGWYCWNSGYRECLEQQEIERPTPVYCMNMNPVGRKAPNKFGLYDMLGNVSEWVGDWYGKYPNGPVKDPKGPAWSQERVVRGCNVESWPVECRAAARLHENPGNSGQSLGLRLVKELP
jgi:formylglycine-generating enzyme required for sulfatase activity